MISTDELGSLLKVLYAAPLEPEMWHEFMERLCRLTGVSCGYLIGTYPSDGTILLAGGGPNFNVEMFPLYNEHYAKLDPYADALLAGPRVGLMLGDEVVDHAALVKSEVYNDFLNPNELESTNILMCSASHEELEGISLWCGPRQEAMSEDSLRLLEMLLPHLQIALRLRRTARKHQAQQLFSEAALDAMSVAAFLVSGDGRLRHMNRRAEAYVGEGKGFVLRKGVLAAGHSLETAQLEQLVRAATFDGISDLDLPPGGAMRVLCEATKSQLQVTVVPAPETNVIAGGKRYALVVVSDLSAASGSRAVLMRQLYGLSPTECRMADLLLEGLDVREAAERMRITLETARFHVKRVLMKTGVRRQVELMRLMLSLPGAGDGKG